MRARPVRRRRRTARSRSASARTPRRPPTSRPAGSPRSTAGAGPVAVTGEDDARARAGRRPASAAASRRAAALPGAQRRPVVHRGRRRRRARLGPRAGQPRRRHRRRRRHRARPRPASSTRRALRGVSVPGGSSVRLDLGAVVPRRDELALAGRHRRAAGSARRVLDRVDELGSAAAQPGLAAAPGRAGHRQRAARARAPARARARCVLANPGDDEVRAELQDRHRRSRCSRPTGVERDPGAAAERRAGLGDRARSQPALARRRDRASSSTSSGPVTATLRTVRRRRPRRTPSPVDAVRRPTTVAVLPGRAPAAAVRARRRDPAAPATVTALARRRPARCSTDPRRGRARPRAPSVRLPRAARPGDASTRRGRRCAPASVVDRPAPAPRSCRSTAPVAQRPGARRPPRPR